MSKEQLTWAAEQLGIGRDVQQALVDGQPVPRDRLDVDALKAIGEPSTGDDFVLTDERALQLREAWPAGSGSHNGAVPGARASSTAPPAWPDPLDEAAYHGLAGEVVRTIEPHTEADPIAVLAQILVGFGNLVGRRAHFRVEADDHYPNLFADLVGETARGRKGTSWSYARRLLEAVDETAAARLEGGLASGEGLISRVRDEQVKVEEGQEKVVDAGVSDKRLLVVEPEFSRVLRVIARDGNTLSAVVRGAWDTGAMGVMTRNSPLRATGAHVSIIGHITVEELRRHLSETEAANGFGNRFLWLCVKRSKLLPEGGNLRDEELARLAWRLKEAADFAAHTGRVERDEEARALWRETYPTLTRGYPGLRGAITARAEAQVVRLSLLYALLDKSDTIRRPHLAAALALWDYADRSAAHIFGASLGDPVADDILRLLRQSADGLTRTEISHLFGRNLPADRLTGAFRVLEGAGLAYCEREETGGRPAERWRAR
jgi:hypothetical protein